MKTSAETASVVISSREMAAQFFANVFQDVPSELKILIWSLRLDGVKESRWCVDAEQATEAAMTWRDGRNVYFGAGFSPADFGPNRRCEQKAVAGIIGVWADIDVKGPTHDTGAAETLADAHAIADRFGLRPTGKINSGTGLQVWWLFKEPWIFSNVDAERQKALYLLARFGQTMEFFAKARKCSVKGTFNLDRVMRVPGTLNQCKGKCEPRESTILEWNDAQRYEPDDLTDFLIADEDVVTDAAPGTVDVSGLIYAADAIPPAEKLAGLIEDNALFAASWAGERADHPEWSASEFNMSIAAIAARAGWSKQEVVNLVIAQRRDLKVDLKLGAKCYEKTIGNAFAPVDRREKEKAEAIERSLASIETALRLAKEKHEPSAAFGVATDIAALDDGGRADAVAKFKAVLGTKLSVRELKRAIKQTKKKRTRAAGIGSMPRIIVNGRQMPEVTAEVVRAIADMNDPPVVYSRGGAPTRIRSEDDGTFALAQMSEAAMRGRIARCADFFAVTKDGEEIAISPPMEIVRDVMAIDLNEYAKANQLNPFPPIDGITAIPVMRPDWSIVTAAGYDAATRLFYAPAPGFEIPKVSENPSLEEVSASVGMIDEAFGEFPYEGDADTANAIGTAITPVLRPAIGGKSPLGILDAPQAGTGKSLWCEAFGMIHTGNSPAMMGAPSDDSEWRKQITATLLPGPAIIVIDNIDAPLVCGSLARALTATVWSDRILGISEQANIINSATWLATGNNVEVGGDIPRRCYRIRLDAKTARPWRGRTFRHPNLLQWVGENRGRIIWSMLTLCRAWHVAGRPNAPASPIIGSFEAWSKTVGGILHFAGIHHFLSNLEDLYEQSDDGASEWERFLTVWNERYGRNEVTANQILTDLQTDDGSDLRDALPDGLGGFVAFTAARNWEPAKFVIKEAGRFKIRLGKQLKQRVGRRYGDAGLHLARREDSHAKSAVWSVQSAGSAGSCGSAPTLGESGSKNKVDENTRDTSLLHDTRMGFGGNTPATSRTPRNDDPLDSSEDSEREDFAAVSGREVGEL